MAEVFEYGVEHADDGITAARPDNPSSDTSRHPLDSEANRKLLAQFEQWWAEARDAHAENRREQLMDADYYDSHQWRAEDAAALMERGQAPLTFPIVKNMVDWVTGTERRTRIDWDVLPRKDAGVKAAHTKKELMKWVSDINGSGWERSEQFADAAKAGVGWTEECYNNDRFEEPITHRHQDWREMWWDPYSTDRCLRDCRYVIRARWTDLDYAIAMFPDRAAEIKGHAITTLDAMGEMEELESTLPQMFYDQSSPWLRQGVGSLSLFGGGTTHTGCRPRVLLLETWYKKAVGVKLMVGDEYFHGQSFEKGNEEMQAALEMGTVSLVDSVSEEMHVALWTPGVLLKTMPSPYKHRKFPFTPCWGFRRKRDGMPYGIVRPARDAQDEYNKRRSKILYDLSTNRVKYTADAMDEADEARNLDEAHRPDGEVRLAAGHMDDFAIETHTGVAAHEVGMLAEAKANIYEASGVTRENTGQGGTGDQSGRAILAKQQQGAVTTAELFDNFRQAIQESGQKVLSNCEQFLTLPKTIRITGAEGALEWLAMNQPQLDPMTGEVTWDNDITADEADFIVDQMDYRETIRMALAETLFEMLGRMPPEIALQMLDLAVDLTDLPNKAELTRRIRAMNGQPAPGQEQSPEYQAEQQAKAEAAKRQQDLTDGEQTAKVRLTNAQADKAEADAKKSGVSGQREALDTAGMLAQAMPLAPAADRLYHGPAVQQTRPAMPPPVPAPTIVPPPPQPPAPQAPDTEPQP
jgi:hypothetical protein